MKTNIQLDGRFAGILGSEYEKLVLAMPQYPKLQRIIASLTQQNIAMRGKNGSSIRTILDLGCGTGLTTLALREQLAYVRIMGVDKEPVMLKQYVKNTAERGAAPYVTVKALQSDALAFLKRRGPASFDAVVSGFFLHNLTIELRAQILKQIARVLRPGGVFVNGDKIAPDDMSLHNKYLLQQLTTFVQTYTAPEDAAYCIGWIEHYAQDNRNGIKCTEAEVRSSLKAAGFGKIRITDRHCMEAVASAIKL